MNTTTSNGASYVSYFMSPSIAFPLGFLLTGCAASIRLLNDLQFHLPIPVIPLLSTGEYELINLSPIPASRNDTIPAVWSAATCRFTPPAGKGQISYRQIFASWIMPCSYRGEQFISCALTRCGLYCAMVSRCLVISAAFRSVLRKVPTFPLRLRYCIPRNCIMPAPHDLG